MTATVNVQFRLALFRDVSRSGGSGLQVKCEEVHMVCMTLEPYLLILPNLWTVGLLAALRQSFCRSRRPRLRRLPRLDGVLDGAA